LIATQLLTVLTTVVSTRTAQPMSTEPLTSLAVAV
jgi:hypothetical protein